MDEDEAVHARDAATTKAALRAAARELFIERGFDRTTVRDIAARAGANQGLLFRYFGSKEALFRTAMTGESRQLLTQTPPEQVIGLVLARILAQDGPRPVDNPLYAFIRSGAQEPSASVFWEVFGAPYRRVFASLTDAEDAEVRADLVLAWLLGISLLRSMLEQCPFADAHSGSVTAHVLRAVATLLERVDQRPPTTDPIE